MGERCLTNLIKPTRALPRIIGSLYGARLGGCLLVLYAVVAAHDVWFGCSGKELGINLPKRVTVFDGGPVHYMKTGEQILGKELKERNIAFDALADNNGNCNLLHVPPESSVCDALSRSQIIRNGSAPFASLSVQQESSKLNTKVAASYPETVNPHDHLAKIGALSESVVDLKLENVKPNSQTETLDQRNERARRELESLIMQKNKQVAC